MWFVLPFLHFLSLHTASISLHWLSNTSILSVSPLKLRVSFPWPVFLVVFMHKHLSAPPGACRRPTSLTVRALSPFCGDEPCQPQVVPLRPQQRAARARARDAAAGGGGERPALSREPGGSPARSAAPRPRHVFPVTIRAGRTRLPAGSPRSAPRAPPAPRGSRAECRRLLAPLPGERAAAWGRGARAGAGGLGEPRAGGLSPSSPRALPARQHRGAAAEDAIVREWEKVRAAVRKKGGNWGRSGVTALLLRVGEGRESSDSFSPFVEAFCVSSKRHKLYEFCTVLRLRSSEPVLSPHVPHECRCSVAAHFPLSVKCISGYVHPG